MKRKILLFATVVGLLSCGSGEEKKEEGKTNDTESTEVSESVEAEEVPFTSENILGTWTIEEFSSELDGATEMVGKTFVINADSIQISYLTEEGIITKTCTYELYDEATIKVAIPRENGSRTHKYTGFLQGNKMRLNDPQGSILLTK